MLLTSVLKVDVLRPGLQNTSLPGFGPASLPSCAKPQENGNNLAREGCDLDPVQDSMSSVVPDSAGP